MDATGRIFNEKELGKAKRPRFASSVDEAWGVRGVQRRVVPTAKIDLFADGEFQQGTGAI